MLRILADFGRLFLLILFLPLFVIFIGPLLCLAVLRGHQPAGPITLNTSRYGPAGRLGAFFLGIFLWVLVWGGLAWLAIAAITPPPTIAGIPLPIAGKQLPLAATATPTNTYTPTVPPASPTPSPSSTMPPEPTATLVQLQELVSPTLPASTRPVIGTPTSTPTMTPPRTGSLVVPASLEPVQPTGTASPPGVTAAGTLTPTVQPGPTADDRQAAIAAVRQGNLLLREAILLASEENLKRLETIWQGRALTVAQNFAAEVYGRYAKPIEVDFDYVVGPAIQDAGSDAGEVIVLSRENWHYRGANETEDELFEFMYTLVRQDGRWVITSYTYRNLATATPTITPGDISPIATPTTGATLPANN
jgi:hypothetical protein